MSVEELAGELRRVLDMLPSSQVGQAVEVLGEARDALATTAEGSRSVDLLQSVAGLEQGREQAEHAYRLITQAREAVLRYLAGVGAVGGAVSGGPAAAVANHSESSRLLGMPGERQIRRVLGIPPNRQPTAVSHVEMKAVSRMIKARKKHIDIAINNVPRASVFGCDTLLSIMLPEKYSMTVYGPNYRKTFKGRRAMVELAIWCDQNPENDLGPGDPAIIVRNSVELGMLIDRVLAETGRHRCPVMIQAGINGNNGLPVLEIGLGQTKGVIHCHARDGGGTKGNGNSDDRVECVYMGNLSEVPADSEVPIADVRSGLHEFLSTGKRPSVVHD
ncbi:MAG: Imm1 family immunity protein [Actinomycetota bacterium]|nr:Imm1 family immunity protein [Actinomycetota bacterium]